MIFSPSPAISGFTLSKTEQCCDDDLFSPFACMHALFPPACSVGDGNVKEGAGNIGRQGFPLTLSLPRRFSHTGSVSGSM